MHNQETINSWLWILICLFVCGCRLDAPPSDQEGLQTYIDARLEFTLRYPAAWAPFLSTTGSGHYAHHSVTWDVETEGLNNDTTLIVVSMPSHLLVPGLEPEDILVDLYQDLTIDRRTEELLPSGTSIKLTGHTRHRSIATWVLEDDHRTYLLSIAAPPQHFEQHEKLFIRIARSLRPYR